MANSQNINEKLTAKQQLFCEFYIGAANGNATEAARLAGYQGTDETLRNVGSENLTKPNISAFCKQRVAEVALSSDKVLSELSEIALDKAEATRDRLTALQLLGKYHKLFSDRVELDVQPGDWRSVASGAGLTEEEFIDESKLYVAELEASLIRE
jgi:phage terminase small subunit